MQIFPLPFIFIPHDLPQRLNVIINEWVHGKWRLEGDNRTKKKSIHDLQEVRYKWKQKKSKLNVDLNVSFFSQAHLCWSLPSALSK